MGSNRIEPKKSYLVKISRKGYEPVEVSNQYQSMNGWFWANLVFGGILGRLWIMLTELQVNLDRMILR